MSKQRTRKSTSRPVKSVVIPTVDDRISLRLDEKLCVRFLAVVGASKRSKTSIVEECLEEKLPALEKQYLGKAA